MLDKTSLISNSFWLSLMQISTLLMPLLLLPYLTQIFGISVFGKFAFGLSLVAFAGVLTDFGFELFLPFHISSLRDDTIAIRRVIGFVYICKVFLFLFLFLLLFCYSTFFQTSEANSFFFLSLSLPILATTLQPNWLFLSLEKMSKIAPSFFWGRFSYLILVFLFVKSVNDLTLVILLLGITQLFSSIYATIVIKKIGYSPLLPKISEFFFLINQVIPYFFSRLAVSSFTVGGTFFLGLAASPSQVAIYYSAEQIYKGLQSLFAPLAQALYPFISKSKNIYFFFKVFWFSILFAFSISGLVYFLRIELIEIIFGLEFLGVNNVLIIFLFCFMFNLPSVLLGYPFLGAFGFGSIVNRSVIYGGVFQLFLLILFYTLTDVSAFMIALSVLFSEFLVLLIRIFNLKLVLN